MSLDPTAPAPKEPPSASKTGGVAVLVAVGIGALVAVGLGVFGNVHDPRFFSVSVAGFSSGTAVKSWLATLAVSLALFQLVSAFAMYRLIRRQGSVVDRHRACVVRATGGPGQRSSGGALPVRARVQSSDSRVLVHSLFGCFFYGVFVTKMVLYRKGLRGWVIPIVGGLVHAGHVWLTSALWFFQLNGLTF